MRRIGNKVETFGVPAVVSVFGNSEIRFGRAAPRIRNGSKMPYVGLLGTQKRWPVLRDAFHGGEVGHRVAANSPGGQILLVEKSDACQYDCLLQHGIRSNSKFEGITNRISVRAARFFRRARR